MLVIDSSSSSRSVISPRDQDLLAFQHREFNQIHSVITHTIKCGRWLINQYISFRPHTSIKQQFAIQLGQSASTAHGQTMFHHVIDFRSAVAQSTQTTSCQTAPDVSRLSSRSIVAIIRRSLDRRWAAALAAAATSDCKAALTQPKTSNRSDVASIRPLDAGVRESGNWRVDKRGA